MLRVMTANLLNGRASPAVLDALLKRYSPDVIAAQELSANHAEVLERHFAYGTAKPQDNNDGKALMSQREMYPSILPLPYRDGLSAAIDVGGESVEVIAIHLANPIDGLTGKFGERRGQMHALKPRLTLPGLRLLMGDMNSTPMWPAYRTIQRHMDDTVGDWANRNGVSPQRTWAWRPNWRALLRIDHVFASGLRATDVRVLKMHGSDHRAVIVDLELT